ncbi:aldose epimerase family protein [Anaeromicropila herbilytica]|uniref:Aldose 1-epimerase n=1 Tax=Anaeromicropila herbilytica TaxID=2785025 RepID=A0A7R7IDE3_9FIRM|nr:aldose epimerase family protein [Anaeromicropila herbilytica]BCN29933.1 aldose 1-epimerase [Anaeromicropila herbilytica]
MSITKKKFGTTKSKEEASLYTLTNKNGMSATFTDYGAILVSLLVPDKDGNKTDVAMGFDKLEAYEVNPVNLGSFIGRHANRIGGAKFEINGKTYELEKNDGNNNLHGGKIGYNKMMYEVETFEEEDSLCIEFSRISPDMEQGFPGNLDITMTYTLTDDNELVLEYYAVTDKDTVVNLTNHSYFNLSGHDSGSVLDHKLMIKANKFTPTDEYLIPTGEYADVAGTPMDFRTLKAIGQDIKEDYKPIKIASGYDHNFVLDITGDEVEKVAELVDEKSKRVLEIYTDMPGLQLYTANFFDEDDRYKNHAKYKPQDAVCLETQFFPNACNTEGFPTSIIKAGEAFDFVTVFRFSNL